MYAVQLSANFYRREFACRGKKCCGNSYPVMPELVIVLQAIRDEFGLPLFVSRGYSCNIHNEKLGGNPFSWHTVGGGADCLLLKNASLHTMYQFCKTIPELGAFGLYDDHFHVDIRPRINGTITLWDNRTK